MDIAVLSFSKKKRLIHKTREWNRSPIISGVPDTSRAAAFFNRKRFPRWIRQRLRIFCRARIIDWSTVEAHLIMIAFLGVYQIELNISQTASPKITFFQVPHPFVDFCFLPRAKDVSFVWAQEIHATLKVRSVCW
jgi:hypothetical protein